jgi:hypothetical protein
MTAKQATRARHGFSTAGDIEVIWVAMEAVYFRARGFTAKSQNCPSGKSWPWASPAVGGRQRIEPMGPLNVPHPPAIKRHREGGNASVIIQAPKRRRPPRHFQHPRQTCFDPYSGDGGDPTKISKTTPCKVWFRSTPPEEGLRKNARRIFFACRP